MNLSELFSKFMNEYPLEQVIASLVLIGFNFILLIVIIALAIKINSLARKFVKEETPTIQEAPSVVYAENDEEDEIEEEDETPKDQIEEIESSIINFDETKVEDTKITTPRRLNLRLRLNASSDGLKLRYSKLRNHLEAYKLRHNFLKHRDVYYVEEEVISKDEQGNMMNKSVSRKVAMITIRKKQLILSLNINLDAVKYVPQIVQDNIVIEERRYDGYNLNLRITTKQDMKDALKLINMLLAQLKVKAKKSHKAVDYVKEFSQDLTTFESRGFGYLVRDSITFEEADKYKDSLSVRAIVINKIDEPAPSRIFEYSVSLDELKNRFSNNAKVNLDVLKEMKIAPKEANKLIVTDGTSLDKKLFVDADGYSTNAIKMIVLVGGEARINRRIAK